MVSSTQVQEALSRLMVTEELVEERNYQSSALYPLDWWENRGIGSNYPANTAHLFSSPSLTAQHNVCGSLSM
ncbi:hypothetical protein SUGI_1077140 [Cryptomeria japonica]|nr:hypothetical protein SUGI_1077140 [Cryptomeria japonica]